MTVASHHAVLYESMTLRHPPLPIASQYHASGYGVLFVANPVCVPTVLELLRTQNELRRRD
jgi:hypothetical protein